ncbi:MAG: PRTRC system protein E [Gemmatimonadaceae bacterium]|nr:PRTRC system protein E [Gemmatimonadaceae bacterium]
MLKSLYALTEHAALTLIVARGGEPGTLAVTVMPTPTVDRQIDGKRVAALTSPLQFVGTPDDIAASFAEQLQSFTASYAGLTTTLDDATKTIESAKEAAKEAASKASKKSPAKGGSDKTPAKASATPTPAPAPTPSQAGLFDGAAAADDSARGADDAEEPAVAMAGGD